MPPQETPSGGRAPLPLPPPFSPSLSHRLPGELPGLHQGGGVEQSGGRVLAAVGGSPSDLFLRLTLTDVGRVRAGSRGAAGSPDVVAAETLREDRSPGRDGEPDDVALFD